MICTFLLLSCLLGSGIAQTVKIKRIGVAPGNRASLGLPSTAPTSTGLHIIGKGEKAYLSADTTGSGASTATSFDWSIALPAESAGSLDNTNQMNTSFTADVEGRYIVTVYVNASVSASDTLYASTFSGFVDEFTCICHNYIYPDGKLTSYPQTAHASMLQRALTGQLEVDAYGDGVYAPTCVRCHTTGYNPNAANGNFGYLAKTSGWDTTWYKGLRFAGGDYLIHNGDSTVWNQLTNHYPQLEPVGKIGCESCHGPANEHKRTGNKAYIEASMDASVCLQCHDAPTHHSVGKYWKESTHSTMELSGEEASRPTCYPCHNPSSFVAYTANKRNPDYSRVVVTESISCQVCHDPHRADNPAQLRTVTLDSLMNGYRPPAEVGGAGQLCMNCHRGRENGPARVESQKKTFRDRFYPHYAPQADMFLGSNAYDFGLDLSGMGTHHGVEDACVTCHMTMRGFSIDHSMSMDSSGVDKVAACKQCHGSRIESFEDIQAGFDYDGDGRTESAVAEVEGLLAQLKAVLPKGADGEPIDMVADFRKDSANFVSNPNNYAAVWNYYFVKNDGSKGIHNTKYAVAILRASLSTLTGIKMADQEIPKTFELSQNYPNPFNPSTEIRFSLPRSARVSLNVFNVLGELVTTLADGDLAPGNYNAPWNGNDQNGMRVASGIYFYRLVITQKDAPPTAITKKMVLMK
jgi:hypothetical protein